MSVAWAVTDLARWVTVPVLRAVLIDARQRGLVELQQLEALLDLRGRIPAARRVRQVIRDLTPGLCDSTLELRIRGRVAEDPELPAPAPAPVPVRAADGRVVHIDIAWPPWFVGLECLGMGAHSSRRQLDRDAVRDNAIVGTPWNIFRATWTHADDDRAWAVLAGHMRAALGRA